jgi:thiol-disulfide isomerase/thioredoxin/sugar lactone lactonase YvrE
MSKVRAPELVGAGGWIGTAEPLSLSTLRGRVVVLDFWTYGCINCQRVLDDLAEVQRRWPDDVVVIGVHSPKFPHEAHHANVRRAVARLGIAHPVLDDPEMITWQQYGVRGWPTVVVIDPKGYVVGAMAGEGQRPLLLQTVEDTLAEAERARGRAAGGPAGAVGSGAHRPLPLEPIALQQGGLAFPSKVASDRRHRLAVADTGHNRVLVVDLTSTEPPRGRITHIVGGLRHPHGVRLYGSDLIICDTGNDRLVRVDLAHRPAPDETVEVDAAGIFRLRVRTDEILASDLAAPWDVVADLDRSLVVAEAGRHRLWRVPADGTSPGVIAGTRYEGLRDGPAADAELAQPSGLVRIPDGIVFVDAESSALRLLTNRGRVATLVGEGLFDWGSRDGRGFRARLQHPQGVAASPDGGTLYVADTYNSSLRRWHRKQLTTLPVEGLAEPGGLDVLPDGRLLVADTGNHRLVVVDPQTGELEPLRLELTRLPALPPPVEIGDALTVPPGQPFSLPFTVDLGPFDLDLDQDAPVRIVVEAEPGWLLDHGPRAWRHRRADGRLSLYAGSVGDGTLSVTVTAAVCGDGLCTLRRSVTRHPLTVR